MMHMNVPSDPPIWNMNETEVQQQRASWLGAGRSISRPGTLREVDMCFMNNLVEPQSAFDFYKLHDSDDLCGDHSSSLFYDPLVDQYRAKNAILKSIWVTVVGFSNRYERYEERLCRRYVPCRLRQLMGDLYARRNGGICSVNIWIESGDSCVRNDWEMNILMTNQQVRPTERLDERR